MSDDKLLFDIGRYQKLYSSCSIMDIFRLCLVSLFFKLTLADEYCSEKFFSPNCGLDEVILVERAEYGRMREGDCLTGEFGHVGCTQDVKGRLDLLCSGRQSCNVRVNDGSFPRHEPCHSQLKSYMDAQYSCLKVIRQRDKCEDDIPEIVEESEGYLSSDISFKTDCGSTQSPWLLRARPGQRLSMIMYDFAYINNTSPGQGTTKCRVVGTIKDTHKNSVSTICQGNLLMKDLMVSEGNELEIRILPQRSQTDLPHFLFHFKAVGCPNPEASDTETVDRLGNDRIRITCQSTGHVNELTCQDDVWVGHMKTCPPQPERVREGAVSEKPNPMSHAVAIVVIVAIAVCVSATILCVGIICLRRNTPLDRYRQDPGLPQHHMKLVTVQQSGDAKSQSKLIYPDTEMTTIGRRHARMRQLYAHTAGLHPERHRVDEVNTDNTVNTSLRTGVPPHIYECPADIVRSPLLPSGVHNQAEKESTPRDFERICRLCGLNDKSCIHAPLERNEIVPNIQYPQTRATNNYSV